MRKNGENGQNLRAVRGLELKSVLKKREKNAGFLTNPKKMILGGGRSSGFGNKKPEILTSPSVREANGGSGMASCERSPTS